MEREKEKEGKKEKGKTQGWREGDGGRKRRGWVRASIGEKGEKIGDIEGEARQIEGRQFGVGARTRGRGVK